MKTLKLIVKAVLQVMTFSAFIHVVVIVAYAIQHNQIGILNFFRIEQLNLYFPQLLKLQDTDLIAGVVLLGIFLYFYSKERDKANKA